MQPVEKVDQPVQNGARVKCRLHWWLGFIARFAAVVASAKSATAWDGMGCASMFHSTAFLLPWGACLWGEVRQHLLPAGQGAALLEYHPQLNQAPEQVQLPSSPSQLKQSPPAVVSDMQVGFQLCTAAYNINQAVSLSLAAGRTSMPTCATTLELFCADAAAGPQHMTQPLPVRGMGLLSDTISLCWGIDTVGTVLTQECLHGGLLTSNHSHSQGSPPHGIPALQLCTS